MIDYKNKSTIDGSCKEYLFWHNVSLKYLDYKKKDVLDIGCGAGGFLNFIKNNYNSNVIGIDPNFNNIKEIESQSIKGFVGYADEMLNESQLKNNFDIVTSFEVLEHVYSYKDIFIPAFSFLKNGGIFCVSTPNAFHALRLFSMFFGDHRDSLIDPTRSDEPEHVRLYSYNMMKRAFEKSGFKNIKIFGILKLLDKEIILKNKILINYFAQHLVGIGNK